MQSGSTRSQETLLAELDSVLARNPEAPAIGGELFSVVGILDSQPALRRAFTEPSVPPEVRSAMARSLLDGKVSEGTIRIVVTAVAQRWSRTRDVVDALERCAVMTVATTADWSGQLDALEDDLFRFGRILESHPALRDALSNQAAPLALRRTLLDSLLEGKVGASTLVLLDHLLDSRRRSLAGGLAYYQEIAAARRHRLVATVWVASPLDEEQQQRLASSLAAQYSAEVHLNVVVDPSVLGGVRVSIGDEIIDSTIENRLAQAQRLILR